MTLFILLTAQKIKYSMKINVLLSLRSAVVGALRRQHSLSLSPAPEEREAGAALPALSFPSMLSLRSAVVGALRHQYSLSLSPAPEEREAGAALPTLSSPSRRRGIEGEGVERRVAPSFAQRKDRA
ncbi:MAG: hypothetical protein EBX40_03905 [Gammaproteobacteria bacterium]|nr:hypothetical protein [Gammaproteobacteria bacterium]